MRRNVLSLLRRPRYLPNAQSSLRQFVSRDLRSSPQRCYHSIPAGEIQFGQPVHETHPHILRAGEVTPGITALEYAHRRSKLASKLPKGAIAVVAAADVKYKATDVFYEYRQDSDFLYLTGFNEPKALAVIANDGSGDHIFHLYVREKDPRSELWDGARSGSQAAIDVFNADESGDIERIANKLPSIISDATEIYADVKTIDFSRSLFSRLLPKAKGEDILSKVSANKKVKPLRSLLNELRVFKSDSEIVNMRMAGQASGRAFTSAMSREFTKEKDLYAFLEYQFKMNGCDSAAFVPVVAAGQNALSIHYVRNDNIIRDGELVLVDGGGEYGNYISDITRTWPVNGKFSDPQRDLYNAVLKVQRSCCALCHESANLSLDDLHRIAERGLKEQLSLLGFDTSGSAMITLFPHHLGHYIGIDVHDCAGYPRGYKLKKGQCITIEPGIYVPDDERWPAQFRGIGIRIEDSICVGEDNPLNLTTEAVKEVDDIEALR